MLSDKLKEGMEVLLDYKTADSAKVYKSRVLVEEGSLIALSPVKNDQGGFEEFKDGEVSLSLKGSNTIISKVRILPVLYRGEKIYLTYGRRSVNDDLTFHRGSARIPINDNCKANDHEAKLLDVSEHGFGVIVNHKYKNGLWIELKYNDVKVNGKIMQSKEIGIDTYFYGCQVTESTSSFNRLVNEQEEEFNKQLDA